MDSLLQLSVQKKSDTGLETNRMSKMTMLSSFELTKTSTYLIHG
jgi:hypothetical protein